MGLPLGRPFTFSPPSFRISPMTKKISTSLAKVLFLVFFMSCAQTPLPSETPQLTPNYFPQMKGCFLLFNRQTQEMDKIIGDDFCREELSASSSFKVALAVMAFDSGVLRDETVVLKWDGKKDAREVVNRDHDARTWMRDSVVWFSQRLTPQIGRKKLKKYLHDFHYGNEDLSGGLTEAWLVGPDQKGALRISAYGQVEFMEKLWAGTLPVLPRAMELTRQITYLETAKNGAKLSGKTGSNFYQDRRRLGWFISHLEKGGQEYIAVTNFADLLPPQENSYGGMRAKEITKQILADLGLWDQQ